jgi:hypothetical protein
LRSIVLVVVLITTLGAGLAERVMGQSPAAAVTEPEPPRDPPPAIPAALLYRLRALSTIALGRVLVVPMFATLAVRNAFAGE